MRKRRQLLTTLFVFLLPATSIAHDLKSYSNLVAHARIVSQGAQATAMSQDHAQRYVIKTLAVWPANHKLTICFLGGSQTLRNRIVSVMKSQWPVGYLTGHALGRAQPVLTYDPATFSNPPTCKSLDPKMVGADIRVGFSGSPIGGNWSYVGTESLAFVPSMYFEGYDEAPPSDPEFTQIVSHEMGHALGLEHEHQSPSPTLKDCLWDYDWIWNTIWSSQSGATKQEMHDNLDKLQSVLLANGLPSYYASPYDGASIMHYFFDATAFTDGAHDNCYITRQADKPDALDHAAITQVGLLALKLTPRQSFDAITAVNQRSAGHGQMAARSSRLMQSVPGSNAFFSILQAKAELLKATLTASP
ncbi:MAG: hypothetical protein WA431_02755 [Candidatus Cybelea sp.]